MKKVANYKSLKLAQIYKYAKTQFRQMQQWKHMNALDLAYACQQRCEVLVEILEVTTVVNIGGGIKQNFNLDLKRRLKSFSGLS